jgi:hypothetical protein
VTYIRKTNRNGSSRPVYLSIAEVVRASVLRARITQLLIKKPPRSRILNLVDLFNRPPIVEISALRRCRTSSVFNYLRLAP